MVAPEFQLYGQLGLVALALVISIAIMLKAQKDDARIVRLGHSIENRS